MTNRNVFNIWDLDRFLAEIHVPNNDKPIRRWLDRVARRWIVKEFPAVGRVVAVRSEPDATTKWLDIEWHDGADRRGVSTLGSPIPAWFDGDLSTDVHWLDLEGPSASDLAEQLGAVVWYHANLESRPSADRLARIAVPDLIATAQRFQNLQREWAAEAGDCLIRFNDGFRLVRLTTAEELQAEGKAMGNCLASYASRLGCGTDIVSLHDGNRRPHVNLEIIERRRVVQIRGKANGQVVPRYRHHVAALVTEMKLTVIGDRKNAEVRAAPSGRSFPGLNLAWYVQSDLAGRGSIGPWDCFENPRRAAETTPEFTWRRLLDLFRGPRGRLVWIAQCQSFEVADRRFSVAVIRFPAQLYDSFRAIGGARCRAICHKIEDDLASLLVSFC